MLEFRRFALPPRYRVLVWVVGLFVAINAAVRLGLLIFEGDAANLVPWRLVPVVIVGLLYDLAAATYLLVPFAIAAVVLPDKPWGRRSHAFIASGLIVVGLFGLLFVATAEALFWNEFSSRFNFIAVDYLIYTREALGNIRKSYPVNLLLLAVAAVSLGIFWIIRRSVWAAGADEAGTRRQRLAASSTILALPVLSTFIVGDAPREALPTTSTRELAGNGYYEFVRAFRNNDLDYHTFYVTMPEREARREMREEFEEARSTAVFTDGQHPLERKVTAVGSPRQMHVLLVTMESLGADFVESYGGKKGLTPTWIDWPGKASASRRSTPPVPGPCEGLRHSRFQYPQHQVTLF